MSAGLRLIPAQDYRRERWRNGLGWTREIVRASMRPSLQPLARESADKSMYEPGADWDWRLSIAEIENDADFSAFPGIDRELMLLHGRGLRLRFADGETVALEPPHGKLRFAGERAVRGELVDGPTRDFNLMWRRDAVEAESWHRPLVGSMIVFAEPWTVWVLHVLSGRAEAVCEGARVVLDSGDTALLRAEAARMRCNIDGGGEVLLIRLAPAGQGTASEPERDPT